MCRRSTSISRRSSGRALMRANVETMLVSATVTALIPQRRPLELRPFRRCSGSRPPREWRDRAARDERTRSRGPPSLRRATAKSRPSETTRWPPRCATAGARRTTSAWPLARHVAGLERAPHALLRPFADRSSSLFKPPRPGRSPSHPSPARPHPPPRACPSRRRSKDRRRIGGAARQRYRRAQQRGPCRSRSAGRHRPLGWRRVVLCSESSFSPVQIITHTPRNRQDCCCERKEPSPAHSGAGAGDRNPCGVLLLHLKLRINHIILLRPIAAWRLLRSAAGSSAAGALHVLGQGVGRRLQVVQRLADGVDVFARRRLF